MIVTVTLNPSLDLTYIVAEPSLGTVDVHRATASTVEASGKGVNVSRTLSRAGFASIAVLPAGGATGQHLADLLGGEGVGHEVVPVLGNTRINTSLLLASGKTIKVNGPGTALQPTDLERLLELLGEILQSQLRVRQGDEELWLAVCGSLPPGVGAEIVGELVELAHRHGARCAADVSGPALAAAVTARADLLAPNSLELGDLLAIDLYSAGVTAVARAATGLAESLGRDLLVSMGPDGALFADGSQALWGTGPVLVPVNTAGAGDAFLAGWLAVAGAPEQRMRRGLAFGRSACLSPHTVDPQPGTKGLDGISVQHINHHQPEGAAS